MKKSLILAVLALGLSMSASAQINPFKKDKAPEEEETEKKKLSLGERIGKVAGNLMTSKTDQLDEVVARITYYCGMYPTYLNTSETKFMPEGTYEGDHIVGVSFTKNDGIGMYEVEGEFFADGQQLENLGLGAFGTSFYVPKYSPVDLQFKTASGDEAYFSIPQIPGIDIISVNGETSLPILDLAEDIVLEYNNPEGSENTTLKVSLLTDITGVRALNHFAEFETKETGVRKVTIPKEALANPEISGQLNAGQFNKGENYLILERVKIIDKDDFDENQNPGDLAASEITIKAFATMPVIVKGKQDEGIITNLKVRYKSPDKVNQYQFNKPSATTGIPFSKASRFGLASFTMSARTFHQETETSVEYGAYTTTYTTTTTTLEFPQLPNEHWEYVMDQIYSDVVEFFKSEYNVEFVPVESVTSAPNYDILFEAEDVNAKKQVKTSYKGTKRSTPKTPGEIFKNVNSNTTADNPTVNLMKEAGDIDGLVNMNLNLAIAANNEQNVILVPTFSFSIQGRDEERQDQLGTYVSGYIMRNTGEAFNSDAIKASKEELLRVCSFDAITEMLKAGLKTMREKEIEMGYDRIWNISEE